MYVCHCHVVSDRAVRGAIAAGARDVHGVGARCAAGTGCGGCIPAIEDLLAEAAAAIRAPELVGIRQSARRRGAVRVPVAVPALARPAAS